ncbi:type II toxin-antitoxin system VapC family toxin [Novosphingobium sp.]|uniref:type II toxin-antitoxin system VapC family toxin n=1 Tax=Novosphingobium sp. TaxID=1874826 RepID=UPI0025F78684|nr:type II toxin-antitoxin system VapC family toxin [Novosphingobium sp.]MCC6925342.1 type II toxin-antitoxin system VapC family toxin [Novosphingobium sp.]
MSAAAFDTAVLVDALEGHPGAGAELQRYRQRFISRLSWIEVMSRAQPDDVQRAEGFLSHFSVIEVSDEIARCAAQLRGQRPGLSLENAVILASAQTAGRILITRNIKDFPAAMPGIRVPYTL